MPDAKYRSQRGLRYKVYRPEIKHEEITVGVEHIASLLDDEELLFDLLALTGFLRCLPPRNVDTTAASVLRAVLVNQNVPLDRDTKGTEVCYKNGWLHTEPLDIDAQTIVCIFPTKLHLEFVEHYLTGSSMPFPYQKFPSIESLAEAVFRRFSFRNLASAARLGTGVAARPVEASYQDEFYRSLQQVLRFSAKVTSEWTGDNDNRIDFRIGDPKWGIELLRDGNRLSEHCGRFVGNGRYTSWIQNGSFQDWLVIDCRTSFPREYGVPETKLRRAVFASDYTSVQISNASSQIVVDEFSLMS